MDQDAEEPLEGGGLTPIVRIGDRVHRQSGPWSATVQALLRHLESVGFPSAPRARGFDGQGREVLVYVEGEQCVDVDDDQLELVARRITELHTATASFRAPPDAAWQVMVGAPTGGPVVCHNDLAPANTAWTPAGEPVFLDWDLAAPAPPLWDLGYAAYRFVPLYDDASCERLGIRSRPRGPRLRRFAAAAGIDDLEALLDTAEARLHSLIETARNWGEQGRGGWRDVWRDTGGRQWQSSLSHVRTARSHWV
jgi:aminoglycoside phosphotransferase (APT) family kinase protein